MMRKRALASVLLLAFSTHAMAVEIIQTRSGEIIEGEILRLELEKVLTVKTADGTERKVNWDDVKLIRREESLKDAAAWKQQMEQGSYAGRVISQGPMEDTSLHATSVHAAEDDTLSDQLSLIRWGTGIFAATYAVTVIGCAAGCGSTSYPYIPVVGPFIEFGKSFPSGSASLYAVSGLLQAGGVAAALYGLWGRHEELKKRENPGTAEPAPQASLLPFSTPAGAVGALLTWRY